MPDCNNCQSHEKIEEIAVKFTQSAYELHEFRHERREKRLWILNIILVILLVVTNAMWIWYESQFEIVESTVIEAQQDGSGVNIVGGGDVSYGTED